MKTPSYIPQYFLYIFFLLATFFSSFAQETGDKNLTIKPQKKVIDTLQKSVKIVDSLEQKNDSIVIDSTKVKKSSLENTVDYRADGSRRFSRREGKIYLYDNAYVKYGENELTAGNIIIDNNNNTVYAKGIVDSLGNYTQSPVFKQGAQEVKPDSIRFNSVTKKALIFNSQTEQQGGTILSDIVKKQNDSLYYLWEGKFTTSTHPTEDPEYYIRIRKGIFVPGKKVIAGFSNLYIADVPTPVAVPFAYFPMTNERTSGLIFPTFGENNNRGYFIQNGGYYFAINDYVDLAVLGDYYTNGSYGLRLESSYKLRYKFSGNLSVRYENLINGQRGFSDYSRNTIYNIRWSHSQDTKSSPNSRFSASVNLGSSNYYQQSVNQSTTSNFLNNTLSSSVSYTKTFPEYPSVNISATATHSQNTNTGDIDMTLPTVQANLENIYPFASQTETKKGIIKNINFQYTVRGENRISTNDTMFFKSGMFDDAKLGMRHTIPINTNFKVFKNFSVTLGGTYNDVWQFKTIRRNDYNPIIEEATIDTLSGFDRYGQYNLNASIGTTVYGQFNFGEDKKIQAIRHTMRPSVSYGYTPSFDNYYDTYVADEFGQDVREYTRFEGGLFGVPSRSYSNSFSFSLNNTLEAKVKDKDSTATEPKKITLLNNFNFSTGYNIAADSLAWSPLRITGSTQLLDNKMTVNFGTTLNPYAIDATGRTIDKFNIENGGSLFRMTNANVTMNYSFSSKNFSGGPKNMDNRSSGGRSDDLFGQSNDYANSNEMENEEEDDGKIDNKNYSNPLPWDLKLAYSLTYNNTTGDGEFTTNSLMFSGNIELTPRWKVGASSGYDFKNNGFTYTQLRFERDLESWRLNFNWVPFSSRSSWYFFIGIKSSMLSDLKWEKRREPDRTL